jgi:hypothetical protein
LGQNSDAEVLVDNYRMKVRARTVAAAIASALAMANVWSDDAFGAPQELDCILTDTATKPGSENRPIVVVFDEDKKTLMAKGGGRSYSFIKVTITYISIAGQAEDVSVGIDRSSLGIVWQQYGTDKVATEYGHCHPNGRPHE